MTNSELTPSDFDKLSAAAYADGSTIEQKNALWRAVFTLKDWHFIARGTFPDVHPYVARNESIANGEYMLKAFTDSAKLQAFAKANRLADEKGEVLFLSLPVAGFMDQIEGYRENGVFGIHFNADAGSWGFFAPLQQLPAILNFIQKSG